MLGALLSQKHGDDAAELQRMASLTTIEGLSKAWKQRCVCCVYVEALVMPGLGWRKRTDRQEEEELGFEQFQGGMLWVQLRAGGNTDAENIRR